MTNPWETLRGVQVHADGFEGLVTGFAAHLAGMFARTEYGWRLSLRLPVDPFRSRRVATRYPRS